MLNILKVVFCGGIYSGFIQNTEQVMLHSWVNKLTPLAIFSKDLRIF